MSPFCLKATMDIQVWNQENIKKKELEKLATVRPMIEWKVVCVVIRVRIGVSINREQDQTVGVLVKINSLANKPKLYSF